MAKIEPPVWTSDELDKERTTALAAFVAAWGKIGSERYAATVRELSSTVERLFVVSNDLRLLSANTFVEHPQLIGAARFVTAPPVSADDLKTLIGGTLGKRPNHDRARRAVDVIKAAWDPYRFPWIAEDRAPRAGERSAAIVWTASIWAIESMRTYKRISSAKEQERIVWNAVEQAGFSRVPIRHIRVLEDLGRGTFAGECKLGDDKCDVPIRLRDGRLLAIECKVSNSAVNSKKRLNNDVGAKAAAWDKLFGEQVITAAVLTGVYSIGNLITAQNQQRITIFWARDLTPLETFLQAALTA